ncbi:MAG: hypothetical protein ACYTGB_03705 [Planctomycetota bacterium]
MICTLGVLILLCPAGGGSTVNFSVETAGAILWGITALGGLAWLLALWGYARAAAPPAEVVTRRNVEGQPHDVADGLAKALASPAWGSAPLLVRRERDELLVAMPAAGPSFRAVPSFSRCSVELRSTGSGTDAIFTVDYSDGRRRALLGGKIMLAVGLLVLIALPALLYLFALPSENPGVRGQVIQVIHVGHLLWPPWLFYAIYRRGRRATEAFLEAAAANAGVLAEAFAAGRAKGFQAD